LKKTFSTVIIGGGAAGLCAAIVAARKGIQVILLEQNTRAGKKILVSGNGRCNITNRHISPVHFHSHNPDFIHEVLTGYGYSAVETFFDSIGLVLTEGKEGKCFPLSYQASSVTALLEYEAKRAGVKILYDCKVHTVSKEGENFILETSQGTHRSTMLLVANGSPAAPQLGGNDSGYAFAARLGHALVPRHPSLVQLVSEEKWVKQCAGVKLSGIATLYANGEYIVQKEGDLLFTNYGISGLAILDLSREVSTRLADFDYCELSLDLMPAFSKEKLASLLLGRIAKESQKPISLWLHGVIHKKLIPVILEHSRIKSQTEGRLHRKEINSLVHTIKNLKLSISDTKGFQGAEVSTGGVDTTEVDPQTMASKITKGLYFAGEVLDVDGDRGGFNFHFAWVSGMRAGEAMSRK
jgi:predicted Rossmann fold flavoprotein